MKGLVKGNPKNFQQNYQGTIINYSIDTGVKGRVIPFVFSPESISDTVSASYSQTTIPGASAPQITYTATGARTVSFSIVLPLDYLPPSSDFKNFEDYLNAFRALVYPKYTNSGKVESPHCKLTTTNIEIDGVCTNCGIDYRTDRIAGDGSMSATVSLSFLEVIDNVGKIDAKFIANSKVNVLGKTNMTVITSNYDNISTNTHVDTSDSSYCNIALLGGSNINISSPTLDLREIFNNGIWVDPGINYNRKDKYTVKKFYLGYNGSPATFTDIQIKFENNMLVGKYVCNGTTRNLESSPFNVSFDSPVGKTVTYGILYVPVYDANKYDVDHSKIRYLNVTKVVK